MQIDLGYTGFGILLVISLALGVLSQFIGRPGTRWQWLVASVAWFLGGLYMSEVLFAAATVDEIQPIIDGLAFDESLLGGAIAGVVAVAVTRLVTGGSPFHGSSPA